MLSILYERLAMDDDAAPAQIGEVIGGRYAVTSLIGKGAMGFVFGVIDESTGQFLALKILARELADDATCIRRFLLEIRVTSQIASNHVVRVLDAGTTRCGLPYLVMERLRGETLMARLGRGPIPLGQLADIAIQTCHGLMQAHLRHIVHRDVKPSNLFLDSRAGVKVIDFGVARSSQEVDRHNNNNSNSTSMTLTREGVALGSPSYTAPEQLNDPKSVDHRADIWSLGVVLYTSLCGQRPFAREHVADIGRAILFEDYTPLSVLGVDGARWADPIIARCLAKHPDDRFSDVGELAMALAPFASRTSAMLARSIHGGGDQQQQQQQQQQGSSSSTPAVYPLPHQPRRRRPRDTDGAAVLTVNIARANAQSARVLREKWMVVVLSGLVLVLLGFAAFVRSNSVVASSTNATNSTTHITSGTMTAASTPAAVVSVAPVAPVVSVATPADPSAAPSASTPAKPAHKQRRRGR